MIDFHTAQFALLDGSLSKKELFEQILNLPCLYTILENEDNIYCLELAGLQNESEVFNTIPVYSSLELAIQSLEELNVMTNNSQEFLVVNWDDPTQLIDILGELEIDAISFDLSPNGQNMKGLIFDRPLIQELQNY